MPLLNHFKLARRWSIPLLAMTLLVSALSGILGAQSENDSGAAIASGGGTTIVEGGTGKAGGFVPVLTTIAFHAEKKGDVVTGDFECLARAPEKASGAGSGQFSVNVMNVTGQVKTATVDGDTATITGTADITGVGAGSGVPFTLIVRHGGPGATAVLTTEGSPRFVFNEILLEGFFQVSPGARKP